MTLKRWHQDFPSPRHVLVKASIVPLMVLKNGHIAEDGDGWTGEQRQ